MNIDKIIKKIKDLREESPTNSVGANGLTNNATASGPLGGYDKLFFPPTIDILSQDYQTPGQSGLAKWRFSNVYPVQKVSEKDVDDMVSASKEFINKIDGNNDSSRNNMKSQLENIIDMIRSLREEVSASVPTNNASSGNIAGLPPDQPPVKQKKKYIYGGHGSRKMWLANKKNGK